MCYFTITGITITITVISLTVLDLPLLLIYVNDDAHYYEMYCYLRRRGVVGWDPLQRLPDPGSSPTGERTFRVRDILWTKVRLLASWHVGYM